MGWKCGKNVGDVKKWFLSADQGRFKMYMHAATLTFIYENIILGIATL